MHVQLDSDPPPEADTPFFDTAFSIASAPFLPQNDLVAPSPRSILRRVWKSLKCTPWPDSGRMVGQSKTLESARSTAYFGSPEPLESHTPQQVLAPVPVTSTSVCSTLRGHSSTRSSSR
ncbi:hypothetical protein BDQ17DRAFT_1441426 [Cyathus striatus]|nr:hypothetical protein BDQ17DRAFT_1441426 [Cyathus striatus]